MRKSGGKKPDTTIKSLLWKFHHYILFVLMEMEKPFPCFAKELICFLNFASSFKDIFGCFEKTIFFGFLSPFSETLYMAFVMLDPVLN